VSCTVTLNQLVKGTGRTRLLFEDERQPKNAEKPEAIRNQNMVEQFGQFCVGDRGVVLPNGAEHRGVRVPVMGDQIAQHLKHATS
jgi:hypothetical protein